MVTAMEQLLSYRQSSVHHGGDKMHPANIICEPTGPNISSGQDIYDYMSYINKNAKECFYVVSLTQKNEIIKHEMVSMGSLTCTIVHPREVFRIAIMDAAASIILIHNHPSGDPTPSPDDKLMT